MICINEEEFEKQLREELKYGADYYFKFVYDDEGNCTITKEARKTLCSNLQYFNPNTKPKEVLPKIIGHVGWDGCNNEENCTLTKKLRNIDLQ